MKTTAMLKHKDHDNKCTSSQYLVCYDWRSLKRSCEQCYLSTCLDCHYFPNHHINVMTIMSKKHKKDTGCLKKMSFWRSCFQLGRNTHDI